MVDRITIRKPDDWHLHVRDGEMMRAVLSYTAEKFGRAIMMPNLVPPVATRRMPSPIASACMSGPAGGQHVQAADDLLSDRRYRPRRCRARVSRTAYSRA